MYKGMSIFFNFFAIAKLLLYPANQSKKKGPSPAPEERLF
jgi:hypothetical protein